MAFSHRRRWLAGLDIGSSAVKLVELRRGADAVRLVALGLEPLPPGSVVDGAITDGVVVCEAIRRLLARAGTTTKRVAISLSGPSVIVKKIALPCMPVDELRETIRWEAPHQIPFGPDEVNLDYHILEGSPEGQDVEVLLVAAKRDRVSEYLSVVSGAGCVPVILDVDAFALQNAFELNYGVHPDRVEVLVNVGASMTNVNVIQGDRSLFTRDVTIGGNTYTEAIQRDFDLRFEDAEQLKNDIDTVPSAAESSLRGVTENLLQEITKTLDFFRATAATTRFDRIVLSGGTSRIKGLLDALAERFVTDVQRFDPLRQVHLDSRLSTEFDPDIRAVLPVAVGLALRRVDDQ